MQKATSASSVVLPITLLALTMHCRLLTTDVKGSTDAGQNSRSPPVMGEPHQTTVCISRKATLVLTRKKRRSHRYHATVTGSFCRRRDGKTRHQPLKMVKQRRPLAKAIDASCRDGYTIRVYDHRAYCLPAVHIARRYDERYWWLTSLLWR